MVVLGWVLIALGVVYIARPNMFRRGHWMRTGIAERNLRPEAYIKYMRGVGMFHVLVGIILLVWGYSSQ
jgi:hypothetical protein